MESRRLVLPNIKGASFTVQGRYGNAVVSASAFDVPQFVDVKFDEVARSLSIRFGYPDSEAASKKELEKGFCILLGVNSGKVLGFEIEDAAKGTGEIVVRLVGAVDQQLTPTSRVNQRLNYETIKDVVQNRMTRVLAGV